MLMSKQHKHKTNSRSADNNKQAEKKQQKN